MYKNWPMHLAAAFVTSKFLLLYFAVGKLVPVAGTM